MARPGLMTNVKFKLLARLLGLPRPNVRGLLEVLWDVAHESGNPVLGGADAVEAAAEWPGEAGKLFAALRDCRLIDQRDDGAWEIHDYWHHAPEYVKARTGREAERRKDKTCEGCGVAFHSPDPRAKHCTPACRTRAWRHRSGDPVTDGDGSLRNDPSRVTDRNGTPSPSPSPSPNVSPNGETAHGEAAATLDELIDAWNKVPDVRHAKAKADSRRKALGARNRDSFWRENWRAALDRIARSSFCRGGGEKGWRPDIDWFLRPGTVARTMEGIYDDRPSRRKQPGFDGRFRPVDAGQGDHPADS